MFPGYLSLSGLGTVPSLLRFYVFLFQVAWNEITNQSEFILTGRRVCLFVGISTIVTALMVWNHIGFLLDDILFPDWSSTDVHQPLILVGNARSGTTWLHRLITNNTSNFTTMKTWEIAFAASVTWRWLFHALYTIDSCIFWGTGYALLMLTEEALLGDRASRATSVHPVGLMEAEEDEWIMMHVAYAQLVLFFYPLGSSALDKLILFDYAPTQDASEGSTGLPASIKREIFQYYKQCVQRHVYYDTRFRGGAGRIFVSKNPTFTLRIPSVYEAFPDARLVCLLRDPVESVPSMISYISKVSDIDVQNYATNIDGCPRVHDR
jgi:hypothetical protein